MGVSSFHYFVYVLKKTSINNLKTEYTLIESLDKKEFVKYLLKRIHSRNLQYSKNSFNSYRKNIRPQNISFIRKKFKTSFLCDDSVSTFEIPQF